jgi:hypothetical protein
MGPKEPDLDVRRTREGAHGRDLWWQAGRAFVTDSQTDAAAALCGGAGDKSVDAVLVDDAARIVFLVQGKYRKDLSTKPEVRNDVTAFARSDPGTWVKWTRDTGRHTLGTCREDRTCPGQ